jgi:hypothetical protein
VEVVSGEKFELTNQNANFFTNNRLFIDIIWLFLDFLLEIENFLENMLAISLKFFISTCSSITYCWFSLYIVWKYF